MNPTPTERGTRPRPHPAVAVAHASILLLGMLYGSAAVAGLARVTAGVLRDEEVDRWAAVSAAVCTPACLGLLGAWFLIDHLIRGGPKT